MGVAQPHVRRPARRQLGALLQLHLDPDFDVARDLGGLDEMTIIENQLFTATKGVGKLGEARVLTKTVGGPPAPPSSSVGGEDGGG